MSRCCIILNNMFKIAVNDTRTNTPCPPEVERLVTTGNITSETTNSNYLLPNTASNDI